LEKAAFAFLVQPSNLNPNFVIPGISILWLYLNGLIENFDGIIALIIATRSIAFVFPSRGIVGRDQEKELEESKKREKLQKDLL
jgi:hypothetical protein